MAFELRLSSCPLGFLFALQYLFSKQNKKFNPSNYESIDKIDFWKVDNKKEFDEFNVDELEKVFYGEGSIHIGDELTN